MRAKEWLTPNHMKFDSLHKTFNRQVDSIGTGNVIGDVQLSGYVRPRSEMERPSGEPCQRGEMQEWDLTHFILKDFPSYVKDYIRKLDYAENNSVIAYEFRHWRGLRKTVHGYVVTTGMGDDSEYKLLKKWVLGGKKSASVIDEAITYIVGRR